MGQSNSSGGVVLSPGPKRNQKLNAQPVKLVKTWVDGKDLASDETVQSCLLPEGVYAVTHSEVVIINGHRVQAHGM